MRSMRCPTMKSPKNSAASWTGLACESLILAQKLERRKRRNRLVEYLPYAKQREFHDAGAQYRERLFMAGNQLGKTVAGSFEMAMHLTGRYPDWWRGRRFDAPGRYWVAGETRLSTRDTVQKLLLGEPERPEAWGMGAIPGNTILTTHRAAGVANAIDAVTVAHAAGGASTLLFKAYEQGRGKWQGDTLNGVWFDRGLEILRPWHRWQSARCGRRGEVRSRPRARLPLARDASVAPARKAGHHCGRRCFRE